MKKLRILNFFPRLIKSVFTGSVVFWGGRDGLGVLSDTTNLKFFKNELKNEEIINILSDIKHRIFPRPFERLSGLENKKSLVGAEIGVAGGEHAESLLDNLDIRKLYLIDPYLIYKDYDEGKRVYGISQLDLDETEKRARNKLNKYSNKLVWLKKLSVHSTKEICDLLDFVYIDGNHEYEYVRKDIESFYPLLKSGGIIGGHDFYNGYADHDGVINAVTEFSVKLKLVLKVELPDWWLEKP